MKNVFQTVVDKDHGNCMQAAVASLFELELDDVPNFIEMESWGLVMHKFYNERGYEPCIITRHRHENTEFLKKVAKLTEE